jgi:hypothetical protein
MTNTRTPIPIRSAATLAATCEPSGAVELTRMTDAELVALRRALAVALGELWLGSRPSLLLGGLSRQTRAELYRRELQTAPPAAHAANGPASTRAGARR